MDSAMKDFDRYRRLKLLELDRGDEGKALAERHRLVVICCTPLAVIRQPSSSASHS